MGANLSGFDAEKVDPQVGFEAIPANDYLAQIVESEKAETKDGQGHYLALTFEVLEGEHKGRNLWTRLNLWNKSEKAVKFAEAELSAICRAVGKLRPDDSMDLHQLPMIVTVKVEKRKDTDALTNVISAYKKREPRVPQSPQAAATGAGQAGAQGQGQAKPSWM